METYKIKVAADSPLKELVSEQEKVAIPLTPLLGTAFMLPAAYEVGSNVVGGLADGIKGDTSSMGKKLMIAGLSGLSALPFIGSAAKGLGHIGRGLKVHSKTGKIPHWMPGAGDPGKFVKAVRTPHNTLLDYFARAIGPVKSKELGDQLLRAGHLGNLQPFRWMDRGFRNGGIVGKLAPSIGSSVAIDYFSTPKRQQLYDELAAKQNLEAAKQVQPIASHLQQPGALANWLAEQRERNDKLKALFERPETD